MAEFNETTITVTADTTPAESKIGTLFNRLTSSFTELNAGLELAQKAYKTIEKIATVMVEFAQAGEQIKAIGDRFEIMAEQAGSVPQALEAGIAAAVGGTVDMEDALQAATGAMVSLEAGTSKIPQAFELARKATAVFGGSTVENFNRITEAVASGSTRQLRQIGIIIDTDKVLKDYAATLGTTADKLDTAQRQQAIMNSVIEKGSERFQNINSDLTPITTSLAKLRVSFGELGDVLKIFFNNTFGEWVNARIRGIGDSFEVLRIKLKGFLTDDAITGGETMFLLQQRLQSLQESAQMVSSTITPGIPNIQAEQNLVNLEKEIALTQQKIIDQQSLNNQQATQNALLLKNAESASIASQALKDLTKTREDAKQEVKELTEAEKEQKRINEAYTAFIKNTMVTAISSAVQKIANNLATGGNIFSGFLSHMAELFGEFAINLGQMFIGIGVAMQTLTLVLSPAAAIAAGIGLVMVGSLIKAFAGRTAPPPTAPSQVATDLVQGSMDVFNQTQEEDRQRMTPETGVQVIVQGNIFDNRETGLRIAEIINDSFDLNGTIIRANA